EIFADPVLKQQISIEDYYRYADFLEKISYHSKALEVYEEGLSFLKKQHGHNHNHNHNHNHANFNSENAMGLVLCYIQLMISCKQYEFKLFFFFFLSVNYIHFTLYQDIFEQNPADFYWFLSMYYVSRSQYLIALYCCDECIEYLYRYEQEDRQNGSNPIATNPNRSKLLNVHLVHFRKSLIYHKVKEFQSGLQVMANINSDVFEYQSGLDSYQKAIHYEKKYPSSVYGDIGYVYSCMMNTDLANHYWRLAVKKPLSEDTIRVYSEYGFHLFWSFRLKEAIEVFDQVIEFKSEKLMKDLYVEDSMVVHNRKEWLKQKLKKAHDKQSGAYKYANDSDRNFRVTSRTSSSSSSAAAAATAATATSSSSRRSSGSTSKRIAEFFQSLWNSRKEQQQQQQQQQQPNENE
ncbi:hypothetical protein RFI_21271, partial [Reticulomyxa filosa]